jgi:hypothetical protein
MTLGVNIVDKELDYSLNQNGKKYGVLLDDTIPEIKTKIFVNTDNFYKETLQYYPNLIKLEINERGVDKVITDTNCLLFHYSKLPQNPIVYVKSVFSIINSDNYKEFDLEPYGLYLKLKQDDNMISDLYDKLVEEFVELKPDDLSKVIKMKMFNFNKTSNIPVISNDENNSIMEDIKEFFNTIKNKYDSESKTYKKEHDRLVEFYKRVYSYKSDNYYEHLDSNLPNFIYTTATFTLRSDDYDGSISGKFIKLYKIFNMLELSDDIPMIAYNDSPRRDPKIKIYNRLLDTLNENSIKSWILNEKKKIQKASYKKIRGLMIKYRLKDVVTSKPQNKYVTITINENGLVTVKVNFEEDDNQRSIDVIIKKIKSCIDTLVESLDQLHGVFTKSKRLYTSDKMFIKLVSVNAVLETLKTINKTKFRKMLTKFEASRIFDSKDIKDIISMYYKRFGKRDSDDESERLGITVNIKDNPYKLNSSTVIIYGGYNLNQLRVIVDNIMVISEMSSELKSNIFEDSDDDSDLEVVLKERKQNVKLVRELGGKMSSITCQKKRQPKINNDTTIDDSELVMVYKGNKYICEGTGKHKYPGLSGDIPCCFEYPGKGMESIVSANILEIKVQPSNFKVEVIPGSGKSFTTFVIRVTSEDIENVDLSKSRYFYLDDNPNAEFPLVHIHNDNLIQQIENDETNDKNETIWLNEVPLYQLISKPKKNTCLNIPHLHKRTNDNIDEPCKHHDKENTFGYNIKSYPCCFEKLPSVYRGQKVDKGNVIKQHIITTDKLLGYKRQGVLQPGLNNLLNEYLKPKSSAFLRWGVNQNQLSFLNCIVESVGDNTNLKIDSTYALKRFLVNYLDEHPQDFLRLNNGNISLKYSSLQEYVDTINGESVIHWTDIIDLVQIALGCNILIIDIPYTETLSKTTFQYEDMRLVCNLNIQQDKTKPFLILIKKQNAFEIIVENSSARWNKDSKKIQILDKQQPVINFVFNYDKTSNNSISNIVNLFVDYYLSSCIKENRFPEKYPYEELYSAEYIIGKLLKTQHKIWFQLVNPFNKINMLVTELGLIVPIKETGVLDKIPTIPFDDFITKQKAMSIDRVIDLLDEFNNSSDFQPKLKLLGATIDNNVYTGILTNFGQVIPVKRTGFDTSISIPVLQNKYYSDVDDFLSGKKSVTNKEIEWNKEVDATKIKIYDVKKNLGESLVKKSDVQEKIQSINKNPELTRIEKIKSITNILKEYISIDVEDLDFILNNISNEVINDNVENLLLNNLITSETFDPEQITKRNTESVWLNINDIKKWFKKFANV